MNNIFQTPEPRRGDIFVANNPKGTKRPAGTTNSGGRTARFRPFCVLFPFLFCLVAFAQDQGELHVNPTIQIGLTPPIPISIEGFSGEGLSVLEFDLYVQGFSIVPSDQAQYHIKGADEGNVIGRLSQSGRELFSRSYTGQNIRREAHAFADDVVQAVTPGKRGIGQTKIAFKVEETGGSGEIYVADFDGHNAQAVTTDGAIVAAPAWVPGRFALLYTSYKLGNPDIFYSDLSTGQRWVFAAFGGLNTSAAVSPDGQRVAMVLSRSGDPNIWVRNIDGSGLRQLTHTHADDSCPCWSPDGRSICYATKIHSRRRLAKISADGGEPEALNTGGAPNPTEPDWSPDGKWIAFCSQSGDYFNICVMPADGGDAVVLVSGQHPSWSPNSRTLVYNDLIHYRPMLSVLDVFTKQHKNGHNVTGEDSEPAWEK
jgi:TolB protein